MFIKIVFLTTIIVILGEFIYRAFLGFLKDSVGESSFRAMLRMFLSYGSVFIIINFCKNHYHNVFEQITGNDYLTCYFLTLPWIVFIISANVDKD